MEELKIQIKKLNIILLVLLSLLMIGSVSAATDNLDDVVKSDATHKETIKHTHTTTTDTSSEKIVEKTNTNTINEKQCCQAKVFFCYF